MITIETARVYKVSGRRFLTKAAALNKACWILASHKKRYRGVFYREDVSAIRYGDGWDNGYFPENDGVRDRLKAVARRFVRRYSSVRLKP